MNIQQCFLSPVQNTNTPIQPRAIAPPAAFDNISDQVDLHGQEVSHGLDDMLRLARTGMGGPGELQPLGEGLRQLQHRTGIQRQNFFDGSAHAVQRAADAHGELVDQAFSAVGLHEVGNFLHRANHVGGQMGGQVLHTLGDPGKVVRDLAGAASEGLTGVVNFAYDNGQKQHAKFASGLGTGIQSVGNGVAELMDATGLHQLADGTRQTGHNLGQGVADTTFGVLHEGAQLARGVLTSAAEIPKDLATAVTCPGETAANLLTFADHPVETLVTHYQAEAKHNGVAYSAGHLLGDILIQPPGLGEAHLAVNATREARMLDALKKGADKYSDATDWGNQWSDNDFGNRQWRLI